jgi:hypothetical protein
MNAVEIHGNSIYQCDIAAFASAKNRLEEADFLYVTPPPPPGKFPRTRRRDSLNR